jgi:folate-dependent tRNA-U54 methylase TrmFO/GidA
MIGALLQYVSGKAHPTVYPDGRFQPMNSNFGLLPVVEQVRRKQERHLAMARRALSAIDAVIASLD